jgi:hypothetical protein
LSFVLQGKHIATRSDHKSQVRHPNSSESIKVRKPANYTTRESSNRLELCITSSTIIIRH